MHGLNSRLESATSDRGVAKDDTEAVLWYHTAADQGHALAQFNLGFCYGEGVGVKKDEAAAAVWYTKAAEQDNAGAQFKRYALFTPSA